MSADAIDAIAYMCYVVTAMMLMLMVMPMICQLSALLT
jgi:hypothetical protein